MVPFSLRLCHLAATLLFGWASVSTAESFDHSHAEWTAQLSRFVEDGRVHYSEWKRDSASPLDDYLSALGSVEPDAYASWKETEKLAFWLNAYNAVMIRMVLDHHPIESVRDIGFLPFAVFRKDAARFNALGGKDISLNHIEHEILRKQFNEPRIHFAIVCASIGCPRLRSAAYDAAKIESQLEEAARDFVRDPTKNHFDPTTGTLHLSSIFDWFEKDFGKDRRSLVDYVAGYRLEGAEIQSRRDNLSVHWNDYDWKLNGD